MTSAAVVRNESALAFSWRKQEVLGYDRRAKTGNGQLPGLLTLGALGVVYGDIGTSPLYALRQCFSTGAHRLAPTHDNVMGILSLIFWSLLLIVSLKYLAIILRATNKGEGGILALMALAFSKHAPGRAGGGRS